METKTTDEKAVTPLQASARKGLRGWWIVAGIAVIVAALVFVGGVFAANRLSAPSREGGFDRFRQRPQFQMTPAKELPTTAPNLQGLVAGRKDQTLSVGQRNGFDQNGGGNGNTAMMDVVVNSGTTLYHDTTPRNFNDQSPSNGTIQQTVEPGSLDGINTNSRVTVWGDQNGNQLTAKVLVYTDPLAFRPQ